MNYYLSVMNILVNDLHLQPNEAIQRLRLPSETAENVYKMFIEIKRRELAHLSRKSSIKKDYVMNELMEITPKNE